MDGSSLRHHVVHQQRCTVVQQKLHNIPADTILNKAHLKISISSWVKIKSASKPLPVSLVSSQIQWRTAFLVLHVNIHLILVQELLSHSKMTMVRLREGEGQGQIIKEIVVLIAYSQVKGCGLCVCSNS